MELNQIRSEFPILTNKTYLNSCSLGALSQRSMTRLREFQDIWNSHGASAWYSTWTNVIEELRSRVSFFLGAETRELALAILAGIHQDHATLGIFSASVEGFDDNSGIIVEHLAGEQTSTVFFVEGRALVKITVKGDNGVASIWEIARRAREKVEG